MAKVCVLPDRFISSSKGTEILSIYIILPSFIKIGQELFEIIDQQTHTQTHTQTHRHIHADENNTCPKTKFLGQVIKQARRNATQETAFITKNHQFFSLNIIGHPASTIYN